MACAFEKSAGGAKGPGKREIAGMAAILLGMNLVYFSRFLFSPSLIPFFEHSDAIRYFLVMKHFILSSLRATGEVPLWVPFVWSGSSLAGDVQSSIFYPLSLPFFFLRAEHYFMYYLLLHTVLAGFFMYCFARTIGMARAAALVAAILYMYGGFSAIFVHLQVTAFIVSWIPALFLSLEMLVKKRSMLWALVAGVFASLFFLAGHPQLFFYSVLAAGCYFVFRVLWERAAVVKLLGLGAAAVITFAGLSAAGLLPALEAASLSPRAGGIPLYEAAYGALPLDALHCFFLPGFLGGDFTCHEGLVALFLLVAALAGGRSPVKMFFICLALLSALFSLGRFSPLYVLLFKLVPGFDHFRVPTRMLVLFGFSIPVLCGFGLQNIIDVCRCPAARAPFRAAVRVFLFRIAIATAAAFALFVMGRPFLMKAARALYESQERSLPFSAHAARITSLMEGLGISLVSVLVLALASGLLLELLLRVDLKRAGLLSATVIILALADSWSFTLPAFKSIDPAILYGKNELVAFLGQDGDVFRVLNMGGKRILPQYLASRHGIELADGYNPVITREYLRYTNAIGGLEESTFATKLPLSDIPVNSIERPDLLGLLNVKYVLSEAKVEDERFPVVREFFDIPVYRQNEGMVTLPRVVLYRNKAWMPRAFLAGEIAVAADGEEVFDLLGEVDLRKAIVVDEGEAASGRAEGWVEIVRRTPNHVELEVYAGSPAALFVGEVWYPGWEAYDNGRRVGIGRGDYLFRSLTIAPGRHRIEMRYRPATLRLGLWISALALATTLGCMIHRGRRIS